MTDEERREYVKNIGKGGIKLLAVIDRLKPIVDLWLNHEMGKQFLDEDIGQHIELMNRVYDGIIEKGEANREDLIGLKITYARLKKIGTSIRNYDILIEKGKKQSDSVAIQRIKKRARRTVKKV